MATGLRRLIPVYFGQPRKFRPASLDYWRLVDTIGTLAGGAPDLSSALHEAAAEIGRAMEAARCSIVLREESGVKVAAYCAAGMSLTLQERLKSIDGALAGDLSPGSPTTILDPAKDARYEHLFHNTLNTESPAPRIKSILIAPITLNSQGAGAVIIYTGQSGRRVAKWRPLLPALTGNLGLAVNQFQAQEKNKAAADREALTNKLLTAIRTTIGVDGVLKVAVEGIGTALGVTRAVIYMHPDGDLSRSVLEDTQPGLKAYAEYRASVLVPSLINSGLDIESSPLLGQLLAGEVISIPDTNESHPIVRALGVRLGVRALAFAPISYGGRMVAALALEQFDRPRSFTEEEIGLVRLVAEQTAVALYQAKLYREAQEAARREALISKIGSAIHRSLDSDAVLQAIVNEVGAAFSVCRARLGLVPEPMPDEIPITHEYMASCCVLRSSPLQAVPVRANAHLHAILCNDKPVAIEDAVNDLNLASYREYLRACRVKSLLSAAIRIDGKPIGFITLHHCEQYHQWTSWEIEVIQSVAEQAAVAIRQAELYREARESAMRAALVNQIVVAIRRSLDLKEILQVAVEQLGLALGADRTTIRKVEGDNIVVVAEHLSRPHLSLRNVPAPRMGNFIMHHLVETRRTLVIENVPEFAEANPELAATVAVWNVEPITLSQIVCPIFVNNEFWGALSIGQTDRLRKWTAGEVSLVEAVTAQVEVGVSHSHLFEEAKQSADRESLISHIIHGLNHSNETGEIFPVIARELGEHLEADRILIMTFDRQSRRWEIECAYDDGVLSRPRASYTVEDFAFFASLSEDNVFRSDDVENDPRLGPIYGRLLCPGEARSFLGVHLHYEGAPRLVVVAVMKSGPRAWANEEVEIVRAATNQVFVAVQRAELFEQVSRGKYEWEATFDALSDGIFIFDQDGLLRRANKAGAALEGAEIREMIGRRCCTLLQGIEGENCRVAHVMRTGRPVTFELVPERLGRPFFVTISPLAGRSEGAGVAQGAVCIVRDLSELRAAEAEAREQRSFLARLIEHANDAIFALSPEGGFVWFNEQLVRVSGYSREELMEGDYRRLVPSEDSKIAVERFKRSLEGQAQTFEIHGVKKNGEARLLLVTNTPIYDGGRITSVLSIARDITEKKLASEREAQSAKLRALGQLASGVAHNFNNILAAVLGHAQLIKRDFKDERLLQRVDIIERAALDGAQTVKRIQGFGLQQDSSIYETVDVNQIVQDSTTLTRARWRDEAQARGVHYEVDLDLRPAPLVLGTASEMREVFVNVILNALDAMPQGGRLSISTENDGAVVKTHFTDSGIGMSREVRDRIFEPFFTTKGVTGMGLGLAVSYSIIERHGGRLEATSNPGQGSTFTISLPAAHTQIRNVRADLAAQVEGARVLVIDDDERVRAALVGMLRSAGHFTACAANGPEGLMMLEREKFDLVFTDLSMPEMDGWAVASEIRRRWPEVKIVLITGYAVPPDTVKSRRDLVNEVVFKPIRFDDISSTLGQVLS